MYVLGYSLDNLSLMALTISTGFVVDDAIVMIENISRYLEEGDTPMQAALKGAEQIGFTIISLTVSLIAVLIPLLFMGDVVGRLFREFAVTLAVTIIISAVVSLTLTPMMCSRILRHDAARNSRDASTGLRRRVFERMIAFLRAHAEVRAALPDDHPAGGAGHAGADDRSLHRDSQGILPGAGYGRDPGHLAGAAKPFRFEAMAEKQQELAKVILQDPAVESLSSFIGADGTNTTLNSGRMSINLKPLSRARPERLGRDSPAAAEAAEGAGHQAVHAAGAEHHGRRPREPHAVPVHAGRSGCKRAESVDQSLCREAEERCRNWRTWPPTSRPADWRCR